MGRWNDLPFEIKCAILKEAVTQLAESWTDHSLPWGSHRPILFSFQQLCAFQLTCREFQQILTKRIKIQDLSPVKCFQRKQYETVSVIIMMAAWQAGPKVGFFYSMRKCLGAFWRNPLFLRDTNLVSHTFHGSFDCWVRNWLITQMKDYITSRQPILPYRSSRPRVILPQGREHTSGRRREARCFLAPCILRDNSSSVEHVVDCILSTRA
jgi:hypothetical protein